jgi:hypothetical protein
MFVLILSSFLFSFKYIIQIVTAVGTILLAVAAFMQIYHMVKSNEPIFDLIYISPLVYLLFNHGKNTAYNIIIELNDNTYDILQSLNSSEYFLISINKEVLQIDKPESPIPPNTSFKIKYKHKFSANFSQRKIDMSELRKIYHYDIHKLKNNCKYEFTLKQK